MHLIYIQKKIKTQILKIESTFNVEMKVKLYPF